MAAAYNLRLGKQAAAASAFRGMFGAAEQLRRWEKDSFLRLRPLATKESYVILTVTQRCNLRCKYCAQEASQTVDMTVEMAVRAVKQCLEIGRERLTILFFGGEPLLRFGMVKEAAVELRSVVQPTKVRLLLQTNGTLIGERQAKFFCENDVRVGLSLDNAPSSCGTLRVYSNGNASTADAVRAIEVLRSHGVKPGVILVISSQNVDKLVGILKFLVEKGISQFAFNTLLFRGRLLKHRGLMVPPARLAAAMIEVFESIINYNRECPQSDRVYERNLSHVARSILCSKPDYMCQSLPCGAGNIVLSFDGNGDVWPCDNLRQTCLDGQSLRLGNICQQTVGEMLTQSRCPGKILEKAKYFRSACEGCNWKLMCAGGCFANRISDTLGEAKPISPLCTYYSILYRHIYNAFFVRGVDPLLVTQPHASVVRRRDQCGVSVGRPNLAKPKRREALLVERLSRDEVTVLEPRCGVAHVLNDYGFNLWQLCDGRRSLGEIEDIATLRDVGLSKKAVREFIGELAELGLLEP